MKKSINILGLLCTMLLVLCVQASSQSYIENARFLPVAGVACGTSTTLVNGTNFASAPVRVSHLGYDSIVAITVTFTRTTGDANNVDFEFQASFDNGTTWDTAYYVRIQVATNETADSNVVRKTSLVNVMGLSHLRLYRIKNNSGSIALTACNATMSIGSK